MLSEHTGRFTARVHDPRHQADALALTEVVTNLPGCDCRTRIDLGTGFVRETEVRKAEGNTRARITVRKIPESSCRLRTVQLTGSQSFNQ